MILKTIDAKTTDKVTGTKYKGTFNYPLPETSAECLEHYGEKGVVELVNDSLTILLQNVARKHLADGTQQDAVEKWVYGVRAPRTRTEKDPMSMLSKWDTYSPEYQAAIIAAFEKRIGKQPTSELEEVEEDSEEVEEEEEEEEEENLSSPPPSEVEAPTNSRRRR